ncbi:hypothetical protein BD408DRAFT_335473 [Parasitella parasitica]|nr:hypothetical protein BD408DRAFT_335473 [Parasitella parasitica]
MLAADNTNTAAAATTQTEKATFGAGCFWGTEHIFNKHFKKSGIISTKVGFMGGELDSPIYKQVKTGTTNHAEVCEIVFDPSQVSFDRLTDFFYSMHGNMIDPTTVNQQGPEDIGTQYRSVIYYHSDAQKAIAEKVTQQVQEKRLPNSRIVTLIEPATVFFDAEEYHQFYLENNPDGYACPTHYLRW